MKRQWISLVMGMVIGGMVFGGAGTAFAANVTKAINATYMNIKLVVDGSQTTLKDANGTAIEPFVYNGTTYLPIRGMGQVFNKEVSWDGGSNTVYIGAKPAQVAKDVFLFDKPYTTCSDPSGFRNFEEKGKNYLGFRNNIEDGEGGGSELENGRYEGISSVVYPLNGNATKVKGIIPASNDTGESPELVFTFYDEGDRVLFQSPIIRNNTAPIDFEFDAAGVLSLKITVTHRYTYYNGYVTDQYIENLTITTTEY